MTQCTRCSLENKEDVQHSAECDWHLKTPQEESSHLFFKGELTEPLGPLLMGIKTVALAPHYIFLSFLWIGFIFSWFASLFTVIITGKYPCRLFNFNLGVLRWSWRVEFYGIGALGTDLYPPFTLKSVDYPADLDISYPERLSRRLAVIKLLLLVFFIVYVATRWLILFYYTGFIAIIFFFSLKYPRNSFDFLLGFGRWTYHMAAYIALMTDRFPSFRIGEPTVQEKSITERGSDSFFREQSDNVDSQTHCYDRSDQKLGVQPDVVDTGITKYAGFWRRFGASFIDLSVINTAIAIIILIFNIALDPEEYNDYIIIVFNYSTLLVAGWLYYALLESSSRAATLGKMAVGIIVTDSEGGRISFGRATKRYFAKIISTMILFIGFLMIAYKKKNQGLHDRIAGTLVIRR